MSEIVVETTPIETVIEIEGGPVLTTTVEQELQTVVEVPSDPVVIDLNSGARGEPGSAIHTGGAYPASMIGQDGDLYVVTDGSVQAGFVFLKENGVWEQHGSIRGPAGGIDVINGYTGPIVELVKGDVGLANVDDTRDIDKPISTATATALADKISNKEVLKKTDPFFGARNVYLPELHNGLFRASDRFNVVAKLYDSATDLEAYTLTVAETASFFDGNYSNFYTIPNGRYLIVTITFPNEVGLTYPGYPYGDFIISTYYQSKPSATPTARFFTEYAPHGGPAWKALAPRTLIDNPSNYSVAFNNQNYQTSSMEFRVDSPASGTTAKVTQIEMNPDRPGVNESPIFDKYKVNNLYSTTQWKSGGIIRASVSTDGVITGSSFVGSGASLTGLTKAQVGLSNVTNDAQVTVATAQTVTGAKTFNEDIVIDGKTININMPAGAGWWARGVTFRDRAGTVVHAGIGLLSSGTTPAHIYIGHGANPYDGGAGLKIVTSGAATFSSTVTATSFIGSGASLTGLTKTQVGLANVTNDAQVTVATAQTVTGAKTFTGAVIVPTPTASNHAATKGYIDSIVDAAPGTLDTLNELAAALGDDPNFATTVTNQIATKEPIISAGTTAQYWRGDKTWQTLDKAAVGLSLINNVAQVEIAGSQTITGVKTFSAAPTFVNGFTSSTNIKLNVANVEIVAGAGGWARGLDYKNAGATATIGGIGMLGSADTVTSFYISPSATPWVSPVFEVNSSGVVIRGTLAPTGVISGNGSGLTTLNGSNISSGTVADARLSTNQATLSGTQTFSGAKTFSSLLTASAGVTVTGTVTATTFSGSGASLTSIPAGNLTGTVAQARLVQNVVRIEHGATASTARPTGATYVEWVGSVVPTNMATGDTWINTSTNGNTSDNRPAGSVMASASAKSTAPAGWYWMEGQEILISGDTALYNELTNNGTTFPYGANTNGSGAAGSTHFRLPNSKGKVIAHADGTTEFASVGTSFGAKTVTLTAAQSGVPAHSHGVSDPGHQHHYSLGYAEIGAPNWNLGSGTNNRDTNLASESDTNSSVTGISINNNTAQNASQSHNNIQPTLTLRYMIKR